MSSNRRDAVVKAVAAAAWARARAVGVVKEVTPALFRLIVPCRCGHDRWRAQAETSDGQWPSSGNDSDVAECRVGRTLPASRPVVAGAISVSAGDPRRRHLADRH